MSFIHLHVHSHYSLLDGLAKIDDLIAKAKKYQMPALAITDHGVMHGVIEFYKKAKAAGIKPIIGVEAYLARNGRLDKRSRIDEKPFHLVLLAKNINGYRNLVKLTTIAHLEGFYYKPRIDWEVLEKYSGDLIALTACLQGEIPQAILNHEENKVEELIEKYQKVFGPENFYLEVQDHPHNKEQILVNAKIFELAQKYNIPTVATNDAHYLNTDDDEVHDILLCLQTKRKKEEIDRMCMLGDDFSLRTPEDMTEAFKEHPEATNNTEKIARDCNLELDLDKLKLPKFQVPDNKTPDQYLRELSVAGLEKRYAQSDQMEKVKAQLEYELSVIEKTNFASYFLIVQDFVNWAKSHGIVVGPGRGSAAGSIVSYLLNITDIDPLPYNLIFERFLNPERISMPDIDLDFADTRRNEVIDYVTEKYGQGHVSQIITFGTMAARASVRDVSRVLGFPYALGDTVAKLIPLGSSLAEALENVTELSELYKQNPDVKKVLDLSKRLEGVARHASTHACGVVIAPEDLDHYLPLQKASSADETIISQYDMGSVEAMGLLKMDFLGLRNLTLLENALKKIKLSNSIEIDLNKIPLNDKKTFALLQKAETTGVFQLESSGMKRYLKQLKPTDIEDIIAMVSLYRPGPIELIPQYIDGKHGKIKITYIHPKLKPILENTYGIAIYQEQILQIARDLAGFSLGEADLLRKAVGKKIPELLAKQKNKFVQGAIKNGINKQTAEQIFAFMEPFAGYGFNKSHGACYALIAYQTAYLKANYPTEFMAALLISDQADLDRIAIEVQECKQMNIKVLPPDINESFQDFTVVNEAQTPTIRFGLLTIKNVGAHITDFIIEERKKNGHYQSLEDLLRRVKDKDLNKKSLESLIKCGALDKFGERNEMLYNIETLLDYAKNQQKEFQNGQKNLFQSDGTNALSSLKLRSVEPADSAQKLSWEKNLLGLYVSEHPMDKFSGLLPKIFIPCAQLSVSHTHRNMAVAGVITKIEKKITRQNETMLFVRIEDLSGGIETLIFPSLLKENPALWQEEKIIAVIGNVSDKDGTAKINIKTAAEITPKNIQEISRQISQQTGIKEEPVYSENNHRESLIQITINEQNLNQDLIEKIKLILSKYPGNIPVFLLFEQKNQQAKKIKTNFQIALSKEIKEEIEKINGLNTIKWLRKK